VRSAVAAVLGLAFGVSAGAAGIACSGISQGQGVAVATAGVDLAVCVLSHFGEPVSQIVKDCGAGTAQDVVRIIDAHKAAMTQELYGDAGRTP